MKNKSANINHQYFAVTVMLLILLQGMILRSAFSQAVVQDNAKAHLVQWIPFRVFKDVSQIKLFYEYQPAKSKFSFGIAPSFSFATRISEQKTREMEVQPFMNIIRRKPKSECYAQFFLKAAYLYQYDLRFVTAPYYHPAFTFFIFKTREGTYGDEIYYPQNIFAFGGGIMVGYRKYFGTHWLMDMNGGLQYLGHNKWNYPEEESAGGGPYIKANNFYSVGAPASVFTLHLGFGYRFIKQSIF